MIRLIQGTQCTKRKIIYALSKKITTAAGNRTRGQRMGIFDFTTKLLPLLLKVRGKLSYRNGYYELCRSFAQSRCFLYGDLIASHVEYNNVFATGHDENVLLCARAAQR
jgi:hypothetical protein